jgi:hypothetical protein
MSHSAPACHPADRLARLQGLFDKADLLVVTPSPPTLSAQHIDLDSRRDLKARLKVKSSGRLANYTRRPSPERYGIVSVVTLAFFAIAFFAGDAFFRLPHLLPKFLDFLPQSGKSGQFSGIDDFVSILTGHNENTNRFRRNLSFIRSIA